MHSIVKRDEYYKMAVHKLTGKTEQRNEFRNAFQNASEKKMINLRFNFLIEGGLMLFQKWEVKRPAALALTVFLEFTSKIKQIYKQEQTDVFW